MRGQYATVAVMIVVGKTDDDGGGVVGFVMLIQTVEVIGGKVRSYMMLMNSVAPREFVVRVLYNNNKQSLFLVIIS